MVLSEAVKLTLDLLYPPRCPVCHSLAPVGKDICPECAERLPYVREPRCRKCGKPVTDVMIFCEDCMEFPHDFDQGTAAFLYDDCMRETIRHFKYKGRKEYGAVLGRLLYEYARPDLALWNAEAVVPVPLHREKLRQRGYNQAAVTAEAFARFASLPCFPDALVRTGRTAAMKNLAAGERRRNLRDAFSVSPDFRTPERILVVDDIYTTGSTADACAAALKGAGAKEVYVAAVCIGGGT